jgi:hypothetical protein
LSVRSAAEVIDLARSVSYDELLCTVKWEFSPYGQS